MNVRDADRVEVAWVGKTEHDLRSGEALVEKTHYAAVLGICRHIDDSEHGPYESYHQDDLNGIGYGQNQN